MSEMALGRTPPICEINMQIEYGVSCENVMSESSADWPQNPRKKMASEFSSKQIAHIYI